MLLRVRVSLPDRPGALGQVARTLGVSGADIVQVMVLERLAGRAVDDFTVVWPGAGRVDRLLVGLAAVPGVQVDGVWRAIGAPLGGGHDAELLSQVAANPDDGLATLVDAMPGLLAADWAAALVVPADWAERSDAMPQRPPAETVRRAEAVGAAEAVGRAEALDPAEAELRALVSQYGLVGGPASAAESGEAAVAYASWRAPEVLRVPDVTPLRARPMDGPDGTRYAVAPFGRAGLVLAVARVDGEELPAAGFHVTEVDRVAQLVRAAAVILGDRLDLVGPPPMAAGLTAEGSVS
jgi:hypothetical protein